MKKMLSGDKSAIIFIGGVLVGLTGIFVFRKNIPGIPGPQGPQGIRGEQGYQGAQGIRGEQGSPGSVLYLRLSDIEKEKLIAFIQELPEKGKVCSRDEIGQRD